MNRAKIWTSTIGSIGLIGLTATLFGVAAGGPGALVQDVTPMADDPAGSAYPAYIHRGDCTNLDPNLRLPLSALTRPAAGGRVGAEAAVPAVMSVTTLDGTLAGLLAEPLAIAVHEGTADVGVGAPVACGEIGDRPADGDLTIGLEAQNGSGDTGIALLRADGDRTTIAVFLAQGLAAAATGTAGAEAGRAEVTFLVPTISCPGCQRRVEASIRKAPGILDVAFDGQVVTATYDPSAVSPEEIKAAIEAGGDTVEPMEG